MRAQLNVNVIISIPVIGETLEEALVEAKKIENPANIPWKNFEYLDGDITVTGVFDER